MLGVRGANRENKGVQLHHVDLGGVGNPPMIVLHGLLGSSRNWLSTGRDLARHFHVLALDARNHGKSPHAPEMTYAAMMDDILAWMDAQGMVCTLLLSCGKMIVRMLSCKGS